MGFTIHAMLGILSPAISIESQAVDFERSLRGESTFSMNYDQLPFSNARSLALRWDSFLVRVSYEEGANVLEDSVYFAELLGDGAPAGMAAIDKRIRAVFGDDSDRDYTNEILLVLDYLCDIPDAIVFDPQKRDLVKD